MSESEYEKQVSDARSEHNKAVAYYNDPQIVLSKPSEKIYNALQFRAQTPEEIEFQNNGLEKYKGVTTYHVGDSPMISAAREYYDYGIPYLDADEQMYARIGFNRRWGADPDFALLKQFLTNGVIPSDTFDFSGVDPLPYHMIMQRARDAGYDIPDKYLEPKNVRDDKKNALYAANDLKTRQGHFAEENRNKQMITSIRSGFLIPDPDESRKFPLILDQFWVVQEEYARLRFLAVEIVSSLDRTPAKNEQRLIRAEKLAQQGIESYAVSGTRCRIDAWRAMSELMYEADVFPNARYKFGYPEFKTISDYVCAHCEQPMIRFDDNWIEKCSGTYIDGDYESFVPARYMHPKCICEVTENY
jgi:hypothetical protein